MSGRDYKGGTGTLARGQLHKASIATDRLRAGMIEPSGRDFSEGETSPSIYKKDRSILLLRSLMLFDTLVMAMPAQGPA